MRKYYIPFQVEMKTDKGKINYIYLFSLLQIAEHSPQKRRYDRIVYSSLAELAERASNQMPEGKISAVTMSRYLKAPVNQLFFTVNSAEKVIILNNDFSNRNNKERRPFVVLTGNEIAFLLEQNDNLLAGYYLYLKYYCGATGQTDTTAKQFLSKAGFSASAGNYISAISNYNKLLVQQGFLRIVKHRDSNGYERNLFSVL